MCAILSLGKITKCSAFNRSSSSGGNEQMQERRKSVPNDLHHLFMASHCTDIKCPNYNLGATLWPETDFVIDFQKDNGTYFRSHCRRRRRRFVCRAIAILLLIAVALFHSRLLVCSSLSLLLSAPCLGLWSAPSSRWLYVATVADQLSVWLIWDVSLTPSDHHQGQVKCRWTLRENRTVNFSFVTPPLSILFHFPN